MYDAVNIDHFPIPVETLDMLQLVQVILHYITLHYITTFQPDVGDREHIQQYNISFI